ncbi:cation:dicarboxylase symporter family transporter [Arthrobacter zhangbolii]|uniref:Cation:dicarboxylase symporter family transporter n=1 Tax=Arthrobacter zhangbolii TaxID=2886936 RepID=A0A9X1M5U1_9MICC|nr:MULTISPECIES: cation:dicarboxylase symporter family transporter [Arthrobacter]MCC3271944.1 cation:dicarboxylase symporter family transporter [Arthrobacter zhangbolii]MCC3293850.1 cation:dicarboxylase symporter family transporter [Arthrobacter zhangbolii]MDN3905019.1 cation:dicarboxylase symporter family transporter [Arthrobacter sp. YD2]UON93240.1 cation:dicarboxylase symporter family transporter [Arthrobacter zhangbolii]
MAAAASPAAGSQKSRRPDRTHFLYIAVIAAVVLGAVIGLAAPEFAKSLKPLGTGFISLIKMMIAPVIFCTIVLGIGSIAKAATVGKVGGLALGYFIIMSTFALAIGLVVGNFIHPGEGLDIAASSDAAPAAAEDEEGMTGFLLSIIPTTLLASLTGESILQTLFVALLVGFALQKMGTAGAPVLKGIGYIQALVFRILMMIMWLAPIGAFGAIAAVVGETGIQAIVSMATLMVAFYLTCILFIVVVLGSILKLVTGVNIFKLMRYLGREYLLIFSTSSSEVALPRLIAKMEHLGISKPVVGVTVPTGYSFNLDGTAIYLTMAALFVASAMGKPLELGEQISLLVFMIIASKGAAGVTGAGLATLAGGLQSHRPDLIDGVGLIVGIDRFMSEARALTNFTGNAVATVLIGTWTKEIDKEQVTAVLDRERPFDEASMNIDAGTDEPRETEESRELAETVPGPAGSAPAAPRH